MRIKSGWTLAALILGIILRIIPIWDRVTWYDENFTIVLARLPFNEMIQATAADVHPPLFYILCWLLARLDLPGWAICRIPSLIAALVSIYLWYKILGRMQIMDKWKQAAFIIFCLIPTQIYYAQEGRQYALLTMLVLMAWYLIITIPSRSSLDSCYLVATYTILLYLHNYGLIYLATLTIAGLIHYRRSLYNILFILFSAAVSLTLFIPWVYVLLDQMTSIKGVYWMVHISPFTVLSDIAHSFYVSESSFPNSILNYFVFWGMIGWTLTTRAYFYNNKISWEILALAFLPAALAALGSVIWQPIMLHRALIPMGAFMGLILTRNIADTPIPDKIKYLLAAIIFIPTTLVNLSFTALRSAWGLSDAAMMTEIMNNYQPGDMIYHNDDGIFISGSAWDMLDQVDIMRISPCSYTRGSLTKDTRDRVGEITGILPSAAEADRIWAVVMETPLHPPCEISYMRSLGLMDDNPILCTADTKLVKGCLYLVDNTNE